MTVADILARAPHVLLDFDGPVGSVFSGVTDRAVAEALHAFLVKLGLEAPDEIVMTRDPFEVLQFAATVDSRTAQEAERELARLEVAAVETASPTLGWPEALAAFTLAGRSITIVSNNSEDAVRAYLRQQKIDVSGVSARTTADPALLKPNPYLLDTAIDQLGVPPSQCVMIGDSIADIQAAHAAGTAVIGYANRPSKRADFEPWRPTAVIDSMRDLARAYEGIH